MDTLTRFAVPFFFVSTGYLLAIHMQTADEHDSYLPRYIARSLRVFVFFIVFYFCMDALLYLTGLQKQLFFFHESLINTACLLLWGFFSVSSVPLWYVYAVAISVLIIHLLKKISPRTSIWLVSALFLNLLGLFGLWQPYSVFVQLLPFFPRMALFFGLFYILMGFFIAENFEAIRQKTQKINYGRWAVIFYLMLIAERTILFRYFHANFGEYYVSNIPLAFFSMMYVIERNPSFQQGLLTRLGRNLTGIYVLHVFYLTIIKDGITLIHDYGETLSADLISLAISPAVVYLSYKTYPLLENTAFYQRFIIRKETPGSQGSHEAQNGQAPNS